MKRQNLAARQRQSRMAAQHRLIKVAQTMKPKPAPKLIPGADQVLPNLWIGNHESARQAQTMEFVDTFNCREELVHLMGGLAILDGGLARVALLDQVADWIEARWSMAGDRHVLVHCYGGQERSVLATCWFMHKRLGMAWPHAMAWIRAHRAVAEDRTAWLEPGALGGDDADHVVALAQTGFWGRAGAGCIFQARDTGRLLLAHRSGAVEQPGTWGTWGGAIDRGETPEAAVRREARQEAGDVEILDLMPLFVFRQGEFAYHNFLAVVAYEFEPALNWETAGFRWCESGSWPEPLHFGLAALLDDDVSVGVMQAMVVSQMGEALAPAAAA